MAMKLESRLEASSASPLVVVTKALVSPPSFKYLDGISDNPEIQKIQKEKDEVKKRKLIYPKWREITGQWEAYHQALRKVLDPGIDPKDPSDKVKIIGPNLKNSDGHYVQDHAFVLNGYAIMANPGSSARAKETEEIKQSIINAGIDPKKILAPASGKLEIGDVVPDFEHKVIFVGITDLTPEKQRTDMEGVKQFAMLMKAIDPEFTVVGLKAKGSPHLGSAFTVLGNGTAVFDPTAEIKFSEPFVPFPSDSFKMPFDNLTPTTYWSSKKGLIMLDENEGYAANVLRANGHLLYPSGYPKAEEIFHAHFGAENTTALNLEGSKEMKGSTTCWHLPFFEMQRS